MKKMIATIWLYSVLAVIWLFIIFSITMFVVWAFEGNWIGIIILAAFAAIAATMWSIEAVD